MKKIISWFILSLVIAFTGCNQDGGNDVTGTQSGGNHNPVAPSDPNPADNSTGVNRVLTLSWSGSDPDPSDTVRYDLIMGTTNPPTNIVSSGQLSKSYSIVLGGSNTKYYWKIVAKDNHGLFTDGPVWNFTTRP